MLQDEVDHPLAQDAVLRRFLGQVNPVEAVVHAVEHRVGPTIGQALGALLFVVGKDDIGAADRLIKHLWDEVDVVHQRIDDRDIVTQGVFQANPGGGVGVHFLGQGKLRTSLQVC